jgi:hypothetical protein
MVVPVVRKNQRRCNGAVFESSLASLLLLLFHPACAFCRFALFLGGGERERGREIEIEITSAVGPPLLHGVT